MSNIRSTTSQTIVTLLGTVQSSASSVGKVIDSVSSSVDMLDRYVQRAKVNQITAHQIEDRNWRRNLILDAAKAQEKIETDLDREYGNDPQRAQRFNNIVADLESMFTQPAE